MGIENAKGSRWTFGQSGIGSVKPKPLSNADRRRIGLSQDSDLEDFDKKYEEKLKKQPNTKSTYTQPQPSKKFW
jgi:hypothetical protein